MLKTLETTGRTEEEAVAAALEQLGMERDDVSVEILERAKSGFLGIGASPAKIRVSYEGPDEPAQTETSAPAAAAQAAPKKAEKKAKENKKKEAQTASSEKTESKPAEKLEVRNNSSNPNAPHVIEFLQGLFEHMGVDAGLELTDTDDEGIKVVVYGPAMGSVIGRRGETLDAIQHLTNYSVNRGGEKHVHVSLDSENYRAKREESLVRLANKMAGKVLKYKRSMALEPMNSYERHVIHTALQDFEGVSTASTGTEPNRRVVISYNRADGGRSHGSRGRGNSGYSSASQTQQAPAEKTEESAAPAQAEQPMPEVTTTATSKKPESREWA